MRPVFWLYQTDYVPVRVLFGSGVTTKQCRVWNRSNRLPAMAGPFRVRAFVFEVQAPGVDGKLSKAVAPRPIAAAV